MAEEVLQASQKARTRSRGKRLLGCVDQFGCACLVRGHKPDVVALAFGAVNDHYQAPGKEGDLAKIQKLSSEGTGIGPALGWIRERSRIAHFIDSMRFQRSGGEAALRKRYKESRRRDFISLSEIGKRE